MDRLRRFCRISLRGVLVVVTVLCVLLGCKVRQAERQKKVVAWVQEMGGELRYDYEGERNVATGEAPGPIPGPKWLRELIGRDYFASVVGVTLKGSKVSDLSPLALLPRLESLVLSDVPATDLSPLKNLNLKCIIVTDSPLSDLSPLADQSDLIVVVLYGTEVSDLSPLYGLTNLQEVRCVHCRVSKEEAAELRRVLPKCIVSDDNMLLSMQQSH